jgi:hypothetical protein
MDYIIKHLIDSHRFEVELEGLTCVLTYYLKDQVLDFNHTGVPKQLEGRGIAASLVHEGLEYAKQTGMRVIPSCPYVAAYIRRHPEYQYLVE